jgi:hypothetical protein
MQQDYAVLALWKIIFTRSTDSTINVFVHLKEYKYWGKSQFYVNLKYLKTLIIDKDVMTSLF